MSSAVTKPVTGAAGRQRHTLFNETRGGKNSEKTESFSGAALSTDERKWLISSFFSSFFLKFLLPSLRR